MANNKVWFITGVSRGFGRIWAEAALQRGDKVAATARDKESLNVSYYLATEFENWIFTHIFG